MRLRSFEAPTSREAIEQVRRGLGEDAVIVATQDVPGGVRVTAAIEAPDDDLAALLAPRGPAPAEPGLAAALERQEVPAQLRDHLLAEAHAAGVEEPVAALAQALRAVLRFDPLPAAPEAPLLLFGAAGAGKTACVAKLAARAVLAGRAVGVVSTDGGRAGGVAQLEALLAPLRLAPQAVASAAELRSALAETGRVRLVDTGGINPFKGTDLASVTALAEIGGCEAVAVLPAGLGNADVAEIAANLKAVGATRLIVTRLDAARRLGSVVAAAAAGLALAEVSISPVIGDGLSPLTPAALARLLLRDTARPGAASRRTP